MSYTTVQIDTYNVFMRSATERYKWKALIYLMKNLPPEGPIGLPQEQLLALVTFTDQVPMPSTVFGTGRALQMFYPTAMLSSVLDMLREEKPCKLIFNADTEVADLCTGREPVGEEEGAGG
jgi:hypothetical protein